MFFGSFQLEAEFGFVERHHAEQVDCVILGGAEYAVRQGKKVWFDQQHGIERGSGDTRVVFGHGDTVELEVGHALAKWQTGHPFQQVERPPVLLVLEVFELGGPVGGKDDHVFAVGADSGRDVHGVACGSGCVDPLVGEIWRGRDYVEV